VEFWNEPHRARCFKIDKVIRDEPKVFEWIELLPPDGERRFALRGMTLDDYNREVRQHLISPRNFESDDELRRFLLRSDIE
jgi:hypothetical protein